MDKLLASIRAALTEAADPTKAPAMTAYMKSAMPFLGVPKPARAAALKGVLAAASWSDAAAWRRAALSVWRGARYREERYAAIALLRDKRAQAFHDMDALPMFEELIVTGAWWDYVDEIAGHNLGVMLDRNPAPMRESMLAWSKDSDMWKRRSSILCQLRFKERTDLPLLYACIEPSIDSNEFFLRKAIGWALRQYAWTDAREVQRYVKKNEARLSGLSKREALKNVGERS
ncbi:DNA alkylation repair enzyme [Minicystis rosea]|nr:DNA alkylation repair enzyme [Minicystis rosea]